MIIKSHFFKKDFKPTTKQENRFIENIKTLMGEIERLEEQEKIKVFELLNKNIFYYFKDFVNSISLSLSAETVNVSNLPDELRSLWISANNEYRVKIIPKNKTNNFNIESFQELIGEENYIFSGAPIINSEAGRSVTLAFTQAISTALCIIFLMSYLLTRKLRAVFALFITTSSSNSKRSLFFLTLFSFPINFANIIALPLLLGIGIDSSIHVFHRMKKT